MVDRISESVLHALVESGELTVADGATMRQKIDAGDGTAYELLVTDNKVTEEQYTKAYAGALGLPYTNVRDVTIDPNILQIIPESTAREHAVIAYEQTDTVLKVAMVDPSDRQIVEFIHKKV